MTAKPAGEVTVPTTCPQCHEPVAPDDQFCESCGATLTGGADAPAPPASATELGTQFVEPPKAAVAPPRLCTSCGGVIGDDGWCTQCGMRAASERDHFTEQPASDIAAVCDRGQHHPRNEDAVALGATDDGRRVVVVCDGVTSATDSDVAALAAAQAARDALTAAPAPAAGADGDARIQHWHNQINVATQAAQQAATASARQVGNMTNPPSCTFVAAVVDGPLVAAGWVGDSRAYWFGDDGTAQQLSVDDSWASGEIAGGVAREVAEADPRAHSITRWLGFDAPPGDPSFISMPVSGPGWLLVCSDGLWNYCSEAAALRALLVEKTTATGGDALATASALVDWANAHGGHDNITAALARAGEPRSA